MQAALAPALERLRNLWGPKVQETSIRPLDAAAPGSGLQNWYNTFCVLSWREIWSSLGSWLEAVEPEIGPRTRVNVDLVRAVDRNQIMPAARRREAYFRRLQDLLGPAGLLCLPTTPTLAPFKRLPGGGGPHQSRAGYYPRTLSLTAIAGLGRLPQVTLPLGEVGGVPIGLSLLAAPGNDAFLLRAAQHGGRATLVQSRTTGPHFLHLGVLA